MIKKLINDGIVVKFINLDIGLGTFKPINTEFIEDFSIHKENYSVEKFEYEEIKKLKKEGYSIVAVGTTVLRVLETINITNKLKNTKAPLSKKVWSFEELSSDVSWTIAWIFWFIFYIKTNLSYKKNKIFEAPTG